jgi:uncharacterized repeat protein (TIGR01451 family)
MKTKKIVLSVLVIPLLLLGMVEGLQAQNLDLSKAVANITTSGNGINASQGDVLEYTIIVKNLAGWGFTNAKFYDNIPAGCAYIAGSTKLNSAAVSDIGGNMPFSASGGSINSPGAGSGVLNPNIPAVIKFRVKVTANGGNVTNFGIVECTNQGSNLVQSTNTVFTNLTPDPLCSIVYQSTGQIASGLPVGSPGYPYRYIRTLNTSTGKGGSIIYDGATGPCFQAIGGAALGNGTVLTYASAIAYDKTSNRIYFVNNYTNAPQDLSYIDLNTSPVSAKRFTGYPLETNLSSGWNINRMSFCSDGFGYGITQNGLDIIRFSIDGAGLPVITRLGALINDVNNGSNDILSESGGDIFGDGSGNLYLIANSSKLYKINPNTKISTFLGSVTPFPGTSNAMAVDAAGNVFIGGAYQNVYNVNLASMTGASITGGSSSNVWTSGDYTSCGFPVLAPALIANKTFHNINGRPDVVGGDTVEYVIEVTNTGNLNAAGVKLYDGIPLFTEYIPGTAKMNGGNVSDVGGVMPFAVSGGRLVNTSGEPAGIIKPGAGNKVTVTFRAKTVPGALVCNQSRITLFDMNGNTIFINSNDPSQGSGGQNPTCFFSNGILPANSLKFKASIADDKSLLQWNITDEYNINRYEIQYSTDGTQFTTLGSVDSKGNSTGITSYQFVDEVNTAAPNRFYRLRAVGARGGEIFSQILKLGLKSLQVARIQPNPFDKTINIQLQLKSAGQLQIRLVDMYGRVVYRGSEQLSKGTHSIGINVPAGLISGAYVMELMTGSDDLYQQKLIKK